MHTVAGCESYVEVLEDVPALSFCTHDVLAEFVRHGLTKVRCGAGKKLNPLTNQEQNLYVLAAGSAQLNAGDVSVALQPGDYFGKSPAHQHQIVAEVVAESDVVILVIRPHEFAGLQEASCRDRHPSKIGWSIDFGQPRSEVQNCDRRVSELASQGA